MNQKILRIAQLMQYKLDKNKHKECDILNPDGTGRKWDNCDVTWLQSRLLEEFEEMRKAILNKESPEEIAKECADICNFAMMIADRVGGLKDAREELGFFFPREFGQISLDSRVLCALYEKLPKRLMLTRNNSAEEHDRWRLFNLDTKETIESTGADTPEQCIKKYLGISY